MSRYYSVSRKTEINGLYNNELNCNTVTVTLHFNILILINVSSYNYCNITLYTWNVLFPQVSHNCNQSLLQFIVSSFKYISGWGQSISQDWKYKTTRALGGMVVEDLIVTNRKSLVAKMLIRSMLVKFPLILSFFFPEFLLNKWPGHSGHADNYSFVSSEISCGNLHDKQVAELWCCKGCVDLKHNAPTFVINWKLMKTFILLLHALFQF